MTPADRKPAATASRKQVSRERFETLNDFVDEAMRELAPGAALVWVVLYRDTKANTGHATASIADIARRSGLGTATVKRAIKALIHRRLAVRIRAGRKDHSATTYRIYGFPFPIAEPECVDANQGS